MINSILTNQGAMIALQNLQSTESALNDTQNQISSGLRVSSAKDDASAWTISTTMKSNVASLNQVSTGLGNADSILGTAVSGANTITGLVSKIRGLVSSFTDPSQNQSAIQAEVTQYAGQIDATVKSSAFNGVNLLDNSVTATGGLTFLAATNNDYTKNGTSSTISTGATVDLSSAGTNTDVAAFKTLVSGLGTAITDQASLDTALKQIDKFNGVVESQAAQFGAVQQNVESQQSFVNNLANTMQSGISNMVDANMTTESARLSALQTQQQLGTQALSIANQAPQLILKLFG